MTDTPRPRLDEQGTSWSLLERAHRAGTAQECAEARRELVERYEPLARRYFAGALKTVPGGQRREVIDDLAQEFSYKLMNGACRGAHPERGRFRYYLRTILSNLVIDHHRQRQSRALTLGGFDIAAPDEGDSFESHYRDDLVERALLALAEQDHKCGKVFYRVLKVKMDFDALDSAGLAEELGRQLGRPVSAVAYRKQLHLARKHLWQRIVAEVRDSLDDATEEQVDEELADLDLLRFRPRSLVYD